MIDKLFDEMGDDPGFMTAMAKMTDFIIMDINNDLKFGKCTLDEKIVGAVLLMVIRSPLGI